jgi:predicted NAD/FAD-binding protein
MITFRESINARLKEVQPISLKPVARNTMASKVDSYHSVIVIGAGAAGLYAAQQLRQQYPDVLVVEAQNHVGGRIRQVGRSPRVLGASLVIQTRGGACRVRHAAAAAVTPAAWLVSMAVQHMCCMHQYQPHSSRCLVVGMLNRLCMAPAAT